MKSFRGRWTELLRRALRLELPQTPSKWNCSPLTDEWWVILASANYVSTDCSGSMCLFEMLPEGRQ